jgi:hypothetical protein
MFEQGQSRLRVLMELGEAPENVDWLWEKYLEYSGKKAPEAGRRSVSQASQASSPAARGKEPPALEVNYEWYLRSRPREALDASELSDLVYLEETDARKALYDKRERAVVAERAGSSGLSVGVSVAAPLDVNALRARPRGSLTLAERELVEVVELDAERERRSYVARGLAPPR